MSTGNSEQGQPRRAADGGQTEPPPNAMAAFGAVLVLALLAIAVFVGDSSREWTKDNVAVAVISIELVLTLTATLVLAALWKRQGHIGRAASFVLGCFATLAVLGTVLVFLPAAGKPIAIRSAVIVVFTVTPAVMWWLFLASQRASLLNEFLANVERLGLLARRKKYGETCEARRTRIGSYLQRFEATYGRLPQHVHSEVIERRFHVYSSEESRGQTPMSTAAIPVLIATVVLAVGWIITLPPRPDPPVPEYASWADSLVPTVTPVTFAFLGAYFFAVQMLFRRYVRSDLRGSAYVAIVMRVALAVIGIWAIGGVADVMSEGLPFEITKSQLCLLGFVIGVFPVVVWRVVRSLTTKAFRLVVPNLESKYSLDGLDGLTVWHQSRLEEEDVENIPNMATADIVDLLVNTRFPAGRIVDWVDQAILLTYLGEAGRNACPLVAQPGIRTASSLLKAAEMLGVGGNAQPESLSGRDRQVVPPLIAAIQTSPNLSLVRRWRGLADTPDDAKDPCDTVTEDGIRAESTPQSSLMRRNVAAAVALATTMLLTAARFRSHRRTVVTDPHG